MQNPDQVQTSSKTEATPPPTDENGDIIIRIATDNTEYTPLDLRAAMDKFNAADNGYCVQPVIYSQEILGTNSSGGLQTSDMRLQMDIIQGNAVDVVMDSSFSELSRYDILTEKGAFVDLYTFLDSDTGAARSDLNTHILELHETDGKLCQMPLYFSVETMMGKPEYVGTKENWTLDELIAHWEQMPDGTFFCNNTNQWCVYWDIIRGNLGAFVDYENGTCSFDSPEFVRLLEFCNQFPETKYKIDRDWNTVIFLEYCHFNGFDEFHLYARESPEVGADACVFVGYPSEDGSGSFIDTQRNRYSICASASPEVQEGAWKFISYMLSEDVQGAHNEVYDVHTEDGFPINNHAFRSMADEHLSHEGESRVLGFSEGEFDVGYLTQAEYERLVDFIASLDRMESPVDRTAQTIIENEVGALFAGERSAEEVAKAIQGRMEIMISERM